MGEGTSADVGRLSAAKSKWYQKGKQEERAAIASVVKDEADDGFFAGEDDY